MAFRRASFSSLGADGRSPKDEVLSSPTSDYETPKILSVLSYTLDRLISRNEQDFPVFSSSLGSWGTKKLTLFHGMRPPSIGVVKYLERIFKYTNCSPSCFVVAYVYIDRLVHQQPDQPVTSLNVHRLLITSVMCAAKVMDDVHYNNAFYAKVGGISNVELNRLELDLLFRLDFQLQVTVYTFESYCSHLERVFANSVHNPMDRSLPIFCNSDNFGFDKVKLED